MCRFVCREARGGIWDMQKLKYITLEVVVGKGTNRFNFNYT